MFIVEKIDNLLNNITMYRLVLYSLMGITAYSLFLSVIGMLPFTPLELIATTLVITTTTYFTNMFFAKLFRAPTNVESAPITAFILILIMQPAASISEMLILVAVSTIAMASKYVLAIKTKHLFNPAAIGALAASYIFSLGATWWVGSTVLLPIVAILGLLIVRKIHRFYLFLPFVAASFVSILFFGWMNGADLIELARDAFTSWPILFFGTIMLTEPLTSPPTRNLQAMYGALVGFLFGYPFHVGMFYSSPEMALIIGNVFSYLVSPKQKLILRLKEMKDIGGSMYEFIFTPNQQLKFSPGQYVEWTLPHVSSDSRGNRRYFTIASAPTETEFRLGVKIPEDASSFKRALRKLGVGDEVFAGQLAGDFTLPTDTTKKLVFIAGGIGVTPFRSMLKFLIDQKQKRDITFFYAASDPSEFMYQDVFSQAEREIGVKVVYVITHPEAAPKNWTGKVGRLNAELFSSEVESYKDRTYYLSGPHAMVTAYEKILAELNVPATQIITDYFPGF